jgi:GntP family gluconate:H+ symporter
MHPLLVLAVTLVLVFVLILRFRLNAFLALIVSAVAAAICAPDIPSPTVMSKVAESFGSLAGRIGIVIALAAVIGECLLESGAADKITRVAVRLLGRQRASLALLGAGYLLAIPVFFDTVFYLLIPLARSMGVRSRREYLLFVMSICAGGICTQCLVPPTPGPLAMASILGIDLGVMILAGALVAIPMAFVGWLFAVRQNRALNLPLREAPGLSIAELESIASADEATLPRFGPSFLPVLLPVLLITSNTVVSALWPDTSAARAAAFFGNANFALLMAAAAALLVLARHKRYDRIRLAETVERGLASAGLIILITAAGGAFGAVLVEAGAGTALGSLATRLHMPPLLMGFSLAALFKVAQGSSTVAMITAATVMAPLIAVSPLPVHPVYLACAMGSGAMLGAWMNDSAFWVYKQMSGFTEAETLKTWTPLLAIIGLTGYVTVQLLSLALPLK